MTHNLTRDQWISFKLGSETYAHSIDTIKEVIEHSAPTPVPGTQPCTEGILNVRGLIVTVISGRLLFGLEEPVGQDSQRIVVLDLNDDEVGVSVDSVGEIISFSADEVQWSSALSRESIITGTVQIGRQLYILTDFSGCTAISDGIE